MDSKNIFGMLGLPEAFGVIVLVLMLILFLAPYTTGKDFGIFKIPEFSSNTQRRLKLWGPITLFLGFLLFIPLPFFPRWSALPETVKIGFTPHQTSLSNLKEEYENEYVIPGNAKLQQYRKSQPGNFRLPKEFQVVISSPQYVDLVSDLQDGSVDLGFFSTFVYLETWKNQDFKTIGIKYKGGISNAYYGGFLMHRRLEIDFKIDSIEKLWEAIESGVIKTLYLNQDQSTSTQLVPYLELTRRNLHNKINIVEVPNRDALIEMAKAGFSRASTSIATLSSDDWTKYENKLRADSLTFVAISDVPIPFGPIVVSKGRWPYTRLEEQAIVRSLSSQPIDNWLNDNQDFLYYAGSGIITARVGRSDNSEQIWKVELPPKDVLGLATIFKAGIIPVTICSFANTGIGNKLKRICNFTDTPFSVHSNGDDFFLTVKSVGNDSLNGLRVLPQNIRFMNTN